MVITIGVIISGCDIFFFKTSPSCVKTFTWGHKVAELPFQNALPLPGNWSPVALMHPSYCIISYYEFHAFKKKRKKEKDEEGDLCQ